jgi:hypothetical protein
MYVRSSIKILYFKKEKLESSTNIFLFYTIEILGASRSKPN